MATAWKERLKSKLIQSYGSKKGLAFFQKYAHTFPPGYIDDFPIEIAVIDITYMESLSSTHPIEINFYFSPEKEHPLHLRLYQWQNPIPLSDILPMMENLDLRTFNERPHKITLSKNNFIWISDFSVFYTKAAFDIHKIRDVFQNAFVSIYLGLSENDGFNKLILAASLDWREVMLLRAYAKYLRQVGFHFSQTYIEKALVNNAGITKELVNFFLTLHDPNSEAKTSKNKIKKFEQHILESFEAVSSLDEDRILRRMLALIKATLRTNYFQKTKDNKTKPYLAIKLKSKLVPELPLPIPLYEIFVYSPRFEAIHLRHRKVARGGIRWSERPEDFRTEILGLMKAQIVKNAVIVPSGAKGGFVLKTQADTRAALQEEVIACYKNFICGLLDLTDNIKGKKFIRPKNVVCYDDIDTYLVVAADKGTATFSDLANSISKEYDYWLGDAFASGGITGYDHKKIGITARGAWESIKRHLMEAEIDFTKTLITVVGIGDMSGDVFGNGMIYSKKIKLVAAFDHRHIFIDPNPDPTISYNERLRLFKLPSSSWEDYNPKLISKGGGVFKRSVKSITLTTQIKKILDTEETTLIPNDLIRILLKAPVDLLYNGGIGTYVKASSESQADVGDRLNEYCRVNGGELRCKIVGEGGNLGFTQLGRIEFALNGGLINTDFIDNSGGVDCSDHEVNLKILLDQQVHRHQLTETKRNQLLAAVTDEVAKLVLTDNYEQALVMSFSSFRSKNNIGLHTSYIKELENKGIIDRKVEFLPDEKKLVERKAAGEGLTRPELAILLAYTKIHIKQEILKTDLPDDTYLNQIISTAFPHSIRKKYSKTVKEHPLYRDIIATQLSNQAVNEMGITYVYRMQMETNASIEEIIRAHSVVTQIFGTRELQKIILSLNFKIPINEQYEMLFNIRNLISLSTRWFLHGERLNDSLENIIKHYSSRIKLLENITPKLMAGFTKQYLEALTERFIKLGLPEATAKHIATYRAIYTALNITEVSTKFAFDVEKTAKVYFAAGERINLLWFRDQLANDTREGHWNTLARLTLRDELDLAQRSLTLSILQIDRQETNTTKLMEKWMSRNQRALERWENLLAMVHGSSNIDYTMFFIAMRELISLTAPTHIMNS